MARVINFDMDREACRYVSAYIYDHLDKSSGVVNVADIDIYIVWKCKTLQNCKYLISSSLPDGMYYEITYNGDSKEWYLDAYKKFENKVIKEG